MLISADCTNLVKSSEGCAKKQANGTFKSYPDPGSKNGLPWTIGWGSTGPDIGPTTVWTQAQCDARLATTLAKFAADVNRAIGNKPTTQGQFDAMVDFHYNTGAIFTSTLLKKHNAGDFAGAQAEFAKWVYNDGKVLPGLVTRRTKEAALYAK